MFHLIPLKTVVHLLFLPCQPLRFYASHQFGIVNNKDGVALFQHSAFGGFYLRYVARFKAVYFNVEDGMHDTFNIQIFTEIVKLGFCNRHIFFVDKFCSRFKYQIDVDYNKQRGCYCTNQLSLVAYVPRTFLKFYIHIVFIFCC